MVSHMTDEKYRVLILDDDYELGILLKEYLQNTNTCVVTYVTAESDFWESLGQESFDILFLDYKLAETTGLDILSQMGQAGINIPTVMMTGEGNENIAARAIQSGALDYLVKGEYSFTALPPLIQKAVRLREMQRAMQQYLEQVRYQAMLLDNMRDAVVVWGMNGIITYWNASAEQLYGAPATDRLGRRVNDVYFPCFDPPIQNPELNQARSLQIEQRFQLPNSEKIWISAHITTLFNEANQNDPIGYMNVARDITPRRLEQEALVKSQHFIKRILDASPNIIYIFDLRGNRIPYVNPEIKVILGYQVEDFTNASLDFFTSLVHPEDAPLLAQHLQDLRKLKDGEVTEIEYRFRSASGEWRWLKIRETVFSRGEARIPVEIIGVIQDITVSKETDIALRKSEARYRAIVDDHQTEMICRFLPDTTLTFVNEAYCRYYGLDRARLVGASFLDPVPTEEKPAIRAVIAGLNANAAVNSFEQQVNLNSGESRWQEWVCRAIFDQNKDFMEYQAVGRDITERKQMEEQIKTAQLHLTQAARLASIGELASGVAHQISNPLTTIIADAQILSQQLGRGHPARESAEAIVEAGWRAQAVINELMKFSQPAQNTSAAIDVNGTIESALVLASAHLQAYGAKVTVDLAPDLPMISGNERQLTDLWVNLMLLARTSFVDGVDHQVKVSSQRLNQNQILVKVSDDGIPIPAEQYDTIFEPQLIPTGSGRGTGMELSICREIVRQNRGQISVSGDGQETTFHITFSAEGM
jgi:PAS domain S-box-containing protein